MGRADEQGGGGGGGGGYKHSFKYQQTPRNNVHRAQTCINSSEQQYHAKNSIYDQVNEGQTVLSKQP